MTSFNFVRVLDLEFVTDYVTYLYLLNYVNMGSSNPLENLEIRLTFSLKLFH